MSNSGGITPPAPGATKPSASAGQVVQLQTLPDALKTVSRAMRIEGEVVQQNRDGSTRIRTPQGDIDVQVKGRQPQPGQKLDVEIPAGNPPRTATIRNAAPPPAQPQPPAQNTPPPAQGQTPHAPQPLPQTPIVRPLPQQPLPAPPPVSTAPRQKGGTTQPLPPPSVPVNGAQVPATGTPPQGLPLPPVTSDTSSPLKPQTPLPASYHPTAQAISKQNLATLPPLVTGQTVRLIPMPPGQTVLPSAISGTLSTAPEQTVTTQLGRVTFQAGIIAQSVKSSLQTGLIQTGKPVLPNAAQTPIVLQTLTAKSPAATAPVNTAAPSALLPSVPAISSLLQPLAGIAGQTQDSALWKNITAQRPAALDAKIIEIKPFQMQMLSPDGKNAAQTTKPSTDAVMQMARPANIVGTVTGFTPQNLPVLSIQLPSITTPQNYILQFTAGNLTQGSQIVLAPQVPSLPSTAPGLPTLKPLLPLLQASSLWPVIDDLFQTFQSSPQAAQALGRLVPSPANAANLGPAAILFIAAAKAGELQNWMGDKRIEFLQKIGKGSLLSRLTSETSSLSRTSGDSGSGEWRSYAIPLLWQSEISKVLLHTRHEPPEQGKDDQEGSTRFLFDLDLTRMGGVQLDGLLRGKRLDLIIRTQLPVSVSMQQSMKIAYADALDGTDIYGEIAFQGDLKNWVNVIKREETLGVSA